MVDVPAFRIPVFVSSPSKKNRSPEQEKSCDIVYELLEKYRMEWRALGQSDYPSRLPLREVITILQHCAGGIILGFEQTRFCIHNGTGSMEKGPNITPTMGRAIPGITSFPTPWNQLEAGMIFGLGLPMLVFRDANISGGIFDPGVTDVLIHDMPQDGMSDETKGALDHMFQNWAARVRRHYYRD